MGNHISLEVVIVRTGGINRGKMSGKFVRASKYRHVFGQAAKKELQYENVRVTNNAWDSNLIKSNGKYLSVNWNSSGGGAFAIVPVSEPGKLPDQVPLFRVIPRKS